MSSNVNTFIRLPKEILQLYKKISPSAIKLLVFIYSQSYYKHGQYSLVKKNNSLFARECKMTRDTVIKTLKELSDSELLTVEKIGTINLNLSKKSTPPVEKIDTYLSKKSTPPVEKIDSNCRKTLHPTPPNATVERVHTSPVEKEIKNNKNNKNKNENVVVNNKKIGKSMINTKNVKLPTKDEMIDKFVGIGIERIYFDSIKLKPFDLRVIEHYYTNNIAGSEHIKSPLGLLKSIISNYKNNGKYDLSISISAVEKEDKSNEKIIEIVKYRDEINVLVSETGINSDDFNVIKTHIAKNMHKLSNSRIGVTMELTRLKQFHKHLTEYKNSRKLPEPESTSNIDKAISGTGFLELMKEKMEAFDVQNTPN